MTAMALGNGVAIVRAMLGLSVPDRSIRFAAEFPQIRAAYEAPYGLFEASLPKPIRHKATQLLRQLSHPNPSERERRTRPESSFGDLDLQWLLRRVDILTLDLRTAQREAERLARRKVI
jgi:hypothetical protein